MFVSCPDPACHAPAEVLDRYRLGSTAGQWEHVRTYCVRRHTFVLPTERVPGGGARAIFELDLVQIDRPPRDPGPEFRRHPLN